MFDLFFMHPINSFFVYFLFIYSFIHLLIYGMFSYFVKCSLISDVSYFLITLYFN